MKKDPNIKETDAKELKKPYEFLSKNERLTLGFLEDCPKQYTETIDHLRAQGIEKRTANNILKRLEMAGRIFRIKKAEDGKIFYRINDFPDNIDALLQFLHLYKTNNPWENYFIERLGYNFKTLFPKYEPKQILKLTLIDLKISYDKYSFDTLLESIKRLNSREITESLKKFSPSPYGSKTNSVNSPSQS